jgi:hypothetical protein
MRRALVLTGFLRLPVGSIHALPAPRRMVLPHGNE